MKIDFAKRPVDNTARRRNNQRGGLDGYRNAQTTTL